MARLAGDQVSSLTAALTAQAKTVETGNSADVQLRALQLDANAARVVHSFPAPEEDVKFAAGRFKLLVVHPKARTVER